MSGSELDDLVEDREKLKDAALENFDRETETQEEDPETPEYKEEAE